MLLTLKPIPPGMTQSSKYATMDTMTSLPPENHSSYRLHRRQLWWQIYLPICILVIIGVALAVFTWITAFGEGDNSQRWAAISTIWLIIPAMILGVLFFAVLAGLIYLIGRLLKIIPPYTDKAQHYVSLATRKTRAITDLAVRPILFLEGILASLRAVFGRK